MHQLHLDTRHHFAPLAHSLEPLPEASDATIATITALMLRRTKIKSAREVDTPVAQMKTGFRQPGVDPDAKALYPNDKHSQLMITSAAGS